MRSAIPICLVLVLAMIPAIPAQEETAPATWYWQAISGPNSKGNVLGFDVPSGADITSSCSTNCLNTPAEVLLATAPALEKPLIALEAESRAWVAVKSFNNAPAPSTKVVVSIKLDDVQIATGTLTQNVLNGAIVPFDIPLTYDGTVPQPGQVLSMQVSISNSICNCYSPAAYARGSSAANAWRFTLPFEAPVSAAVTEVTDALLIEKNATGESFVESFAQFTNATGNISVNWTAIPEGNFTIRVSNVAKETAATNETVADSNATTNLTLRQQNTTGNETGNSTGNSTGNETMNSTSSSGTLLIKVFDEFGLTAEHTFDHISDFVLDLSNGANGTYRIDVELIGYTGDVTIEGAPTIVEVVSEPEPVAETEDAPAKKSPGVSIVALLAGLALAGSRRRK